MYQEEWLIHKIDSQEWDTRLKRRTQHYGYVYDYKARSVDKSAYIGELPEWLTRLAKFIELPFGAEQAIVNEYEPGQGIAQHVDCLACFGRTIASLSLGSGCTMDLISLSNKSVKSIFLEPRSLLTLDKESRVDWSHGIASKKSDVIDDQKNARGRRLSITFRSILLGQ